MTGRPSSGDAVLRVTTASEYAHQTLRALIVRGTLRPGATLRLADVAAELEVSTMPVRAALLKLEAEGLVCQLSRRGGAIVAPLELGEFREIQAIRSALETWAAREGASRLTDADLDEMQLLYGRAASMAADGDVDSFLEDVSSLHNLCYRAAGFPRLLALVVDYQRQAERYIRIALLHADRGLAAPTHFQESFLRACERRDGDAAARTLVEALAWTVNQLAPIIERLSSNAVDADNEQRSK